jgi:outer membrane receptor for ferrienterochelin and colicins
MIGGVLLVSNLAWSQVTLSGRVIDQQSHPIGFAKVVVEGKSYGTICNIDGEFQITDLGEGSYSIKAYAPGYLEERTSFNLEKGAAKNIELILQQDLLEMERIVVTGTRDRVGRHETPVITNTIGSAIFDATHALSAAEGLSFSPGLRVENNCQNCGFTQLRMNGLEGAYSQVLINSRPVFSALAGVYGLEMLPTSMIDRVEVVRGGGSVLYGGNAIAGTVNIITKDPVKNTFEVGVNQAFLNGESSDRTVHANGSVVSEDLKKGVSFFGFNRSRDYWDANDDGFSEIVMLQNNTFGFDAFWNMDHRNTLKFGAFFIDEFRRGGNKFELFPHQTDVTEQLQHNIISANASYEHYSKSLKHKISIYGSLQAVERDSYYGAGGRVIEEGDTLTPEDILAINAYGTSQDLSVVGGMQYNYQMNKKLQFILGTEYVFNDVKDEMPGYNRKIDQRVGTFGNFAQVELKPLEKLTLLAGARFDHLSIQGDYDLNTERFENNRELNIVVPRFSAMYDVHKDLKLRASFAQGYRGPQAFDEDLHIETVGGAARFIRINTGLTEERSNSTMVSLNYDKVIKRWQLNFVVEGFYTQLINPFIFSGQTELPSGVAIIDKRNGEGAMVSGLNLEANFAYGSKLRFQSGATWQTARYDVEEEVWAPEDPADLTPVTSTLRLLRTPDFYGYFSAIYEPFQNFLIAYSGVITGAMDVPHVINAESEQTIIKRTPAFFDNNIKLSYDLQLKSKSSVQLSAGVQNIFNSYQEDFDSGADRDAGYVYGPIRPRTFFMGLKFGLNQDSY